jgi:hypothetical protein
VRVSPHRERSFRRLGVALKDHELAAKHEVFGHKTRPARSAASDRTDERSRIANTAETLARFTIGVARESHLSSVVGSWGCSWLSLHLERGPKTHF